MTFIFPCCNKKATLPLLSITENWKDFSLRLKHKALVTVLEVALIKFIVMQILLVKMPLGLNLVAVCCLWLHFSICLRNSKHFEREMIHNSWVRIPANRVFFRSKSVPTKKRVLGLESEHSKEETLIGTVLILKISTTQVDLLFIVTSLTRKSSVKSNNTSVTWHYRLKTK